VRDPVLLAVQHPVPASLLSIRGHASGVRPSLGLRQREATENKPAREIWQPTTLLLITTECLDAVHHETALNGNAAAQAAVAALQLLADQAVAHVIETGATVLAQRRTEQTEIGETRHELGREALGSEAFADDGQDFHIDEARNVALHHPL